jgi:hypothetical protein
MGTMSATNADAITPMGMENLPRCHGPGRNLLPTKKTRMTMGIVNALGAVSFFGFQVHWGRKWYSHERRDRSDGE